MLTHVAGLVLLVMMALAVALVSRRLPLPFTLARVVVGLILGLLHVLSDGSVLPSFYGERYRALL